MRRGGTAIRRVLMGGRAAEALVFDGEVSTGASDALQRATEIATEMVTRYGMTEKLGPPPLCTAAATVPYWNDGEPRSGVGGDRARCGILWRDLSTGHPKSYGRAGLTLMNLRRSTEPIR